ncbi:hypothetical protein [Bradyrhizobium sp. CCGB20]
MQGRRLRKDHLINEIRIPQGSAVMVCTYSLAGIVLMCSCRTGLMNLRP